MTKSYDDYERDYQNHLGRIRSVLAASTRSPSALQECTRLLQQARQCATAMQAMAQVEGNTFRTQEAQNLVPRDIIPLEQEVQKRNGGFGDVEAQQREDLFYRPPTQEHLATESLIESSNDLLRESQALVSESESIGMSTLTQMSMQREQMQIASDNMNETVNLTAHARSILKKMRHRVFKNKLALYCMIALLIFLNGLVLRGIWRKHHHN